MAIKYQPIWDELKLTSLVVLAVPPVLHAKVLKEVQRIKDLDIDFKFQESEKRKRHRLTSETEGARIIIKMTEYADLNELGAEEL